MSNAQDKATIRQQSSENNSVSSSEWDMANDVFVSGYDDNPMGDGAAAAGDRDPAQPGLDRHLPLLSQDGMMLGLAGEEYSGSSYLSIDPNYTESDGNVTAKKRIRSNSSRHRGEVVTELGPEEVRWFYKEDKRTWKPFVGHDSLKIEIVYRRFCEQNPDKVKYPVEPAEAEGKEAANSGEIQPESGAVDSSVRADPAVQRGGGRQRSTSEEMKEPDDISVSVEAVCVRGGLYEVDIREKECYPVYWNQQDRIPVMRGQWFIDGTWLPLEEDESDLIEMDHLSRFRGQQMRDTYEMEVLTTTVDSKDAIHSLKLSRSHVDWHSVDEVYLYSDATTSKIARTVTQKLGFSKASSSGTRLHRGYVEEAAPEDTPPETTHIVFVVHGIGQKMDQGRIIRNTSMMRDAARKMEEKHFSDRTTEHVEFLPVEWRSKLALDGDTVDSITPDKVRGLRDMLNSSAMDIMYYTSPLYRDEITRGLTLELNRLYSLFCSRNPDFEKNGKVSIVSHSLGCVITFDIMTGWDPVRFHHQEALDPEETKVRWPSDEERYLQEQLRLTRLRYCTGYQFQ
ncbi:Phospholipase DDHD1 [Larimichthys crocea]|uniref:Phospholipase DDHD1 n=1 Tax=Larimichthys crocea TaxID=215358 RepID=A0A6G0I798_LARCR|nr:Phospholipase DDHD1 [Larimichthys crocea]